MVALREFTLFNALKKSVQIFSSYYQIISTIPQAGLWPIRAKEEPVKRSSWANNEWSPDINWGLGSIAIRSFFQWQNIHPNYFNSSKKVYKQVCLITIQTSILHITYYQSDDIVTNNVFLWMTMVNCEFYFFARILHNWAWRKVIIKSMLRDLGDAF